jgi:hypothetical protein
MGPGKAFPRCVGVIHRIWLADPRSAEARTRAAARAVIGGCPTLPAVCAGGWAFVNVDTTPSLELSAVIHGVIPNTRVFTSGRRDLS